MKSTVAIATIISGTLLLLAPYASNAVGTAIVADTIARIGKGVDLTGHMPDWYDAGCFITGLAMILTGVTSSLGLRNKNAGNASAERE